MVEDGELCEEEEAVSALSAIKGGVVMTDGAGKGKGRGKGKKNATDGAAGAGAGSAGKVKQAISAGALFAADAPANAWAEIDYSSQLLNSNDLLFEDAKESHYAGSMVMHVNKEHKIHRLDYHWKEVIIDE